MIQDFLAAVVVSLMVVAGCVLVVGYLTQPTFANRCDHCGEYVEDAEAVHEHFARCHPCR